MHKADLVKAIRASMSIPGVFAPVEIEGKLLEDGGIADNLPIDVARQMGADVLIVVEIGTSLRSRDRLESAVAITAQVITFIIQRNTMEQLSTLGSGDVHHPADAWRYWYK